MPEYSHLDLTLSALIDRGDQIIPILSLFKEKKIQSYKEIRRKLSIENLNLKLSYLIQIDAISYIKHKNVLYFTLNTTYGKKRYLLPYYLSLSNDKVLCIELFQKGVLKISDSSDKYIDDPSVKIITTQELKKSRLTNYVTDFVLTDESKNSDRFLVLNYDYLDYKLLNKIILKDLSKKYYNLSAIFNENNSKLEQILQYDEIFEKNDQNGPFFRPSILSSDNKNGSNSEFLKNENRLENLLMRNSLSLRINLQNLRQSIISNLLPYNLRSLYTLIKKNNFLPDDKIQSVSLQSRNYFRLGIIKLHKLNLLQMMKNGYTATADDNSVIKLLIEEILKNNHGIHEIFVLEYISK